MSSIPPSFRVCVRPLHREHIGAALRVCARHGAVVEGSARHDGDRFRFCIDLGRLPNGDGPSIEEVIWRDIDREARR